MNYPQSLTYQPQGKGIVWTVHHLPAWLDKIKRPIVKPSLPVRHVSRDDPPEPQSKGGRKKGDKDWGPRKLISETPCERTLRNRAKREEYWRKQGEQGMKVPKL